MLDSSAITRHAASFRDPSGFIFERDQCKLRQVNHCYAADYDALMTGGLYDELVATGLLLPHAELPIDCRATEAAYKVLQPVQLPLISYPYEWSFDQLRDAALVTLEIERRALARGMTLKDASAYNVQLSSGRPKLIDTLSLQRYRPGQPWGAYRQFCQHFLAPLALMSRVDVRLGQLLRVYIDGVPLDLAARLLPWRSKLSLALGLHICAHARSQSKYAHAALPGGALPGGAFPRDDAPQLSRRGREALLAGLTAAVVGLQWRNKKTQWSDYYAADQNYGAAGMDQKERVVRDLICAVKPQTVWDLGANDGHFSRIAARCGAQTVVAWDIDPQCVEQNYRQVRAESDPVIHPLLLDLTNPTPGVGWANNERASFAARGPADLLLALGLIHHLAIVNNSPLDQVAAYLASLGKWLIIEWVPKEDSQVQRLLGSREDIFSLYDRHGFEAAFGQYFTIERVVELAGTKRSIYLLARERPIEVNHD